MGLGLYFNCGSCDDDDDEGVCRHALCREYFWRGSYSTFHYVRVAIRMASILESCGGGANAVAFHEHADTEGWWSAAEVRGVLSYLQIVFPVLTSRISHVVEGMRWALNEPELDLGDGAWVIERTEELIAGLELAARDELSIHFG